MLRRLMSLAILAFVIGLIGCEKGPVSSNKDMPVKSGPPVEGKNKKSTSIEASLDEGK